jgi:hypothetical protein
MYPITAQAHAVAVVVVVVAAMQAAPAGTAETEAMPNATVRIVVEREVETVSLIHAVTRDLLPR